MKDRWSHAHPHCGLLLPVRRASEGLSWSKSWSAFFSSLGCSASHSGFWPEGSAVGLWVHGGDTPGCRSSGLVPWFLRDFDLVSPWQPWRWVHWNKETENPCFSVWPRLHVGKIAVTPHGSEEWFVTKSTELWVKEGRLHCCFQKILHVIPSLIIKREMFMYLNEWGISGILLTSYKHALALKNSLDSYNLCLNILLHDVLPESLGL